MTVIDIRRGPNLPWQIKLIRENGIELVNRFRPFFYVIVKKSQVKATEQLITDLARNLIIAEKRQLEKKYPLLQVEQYSTEMFEEPATIEELPDFRPWIYKPSLGRYVIDPEYTVLKVVLWVPQHVRSLANMLRERGYKCSAFNIVYTCRYVMSNPWHNPCGIEPFYYTLDLDILSKLKLRYMVYDVEVLKDGTRIVSIYEKELLEQVDYDKIMKEAESYVIEKPDNVDSLVKRLEKTCAVWVGFNNGRTPDLGYDNPKLLEIGVPRDIFEKKALIDLSLTIQLQAQASGIGTASFALADIMLALREKMNPPRELIIMKLSSALMLQSRDTAVRYNKGDIAISVGLAELYLPYIFGVAAFTGLSPDAVAHTLRPGMIFEYTLVKWLEIHGEVAEAREIAASPEERALLSGTKVFTFLDLAEILSAYREELEKLLNKTNDLNTIVKVARQIADRVIKTKIKRGEKRKEGKIETLFTGKIVHVDVDMMYPTKILRENICPCCFVKRRQTLQEEIYYAEDAKFDIVRNVAPFFALVQFLYKLRKWAKDNHKLYKKLAEEAKKQGKEEEAAYYKKLAEFFKLLSDLIKPLINSAYGAMAKGSGPVHLGLLIVALKIFLSTIRDLLTMMISAKLLGYEPLYGDTDSLFVKVPDNVPDTEVVEKLQQIANMLGYTISHEGTYSFMYIFAKKSYAVGKPGEFVKVKGQLIGSIKHLTSPIVRASIIEALEKGTVQPIIETIMQIDNPLLLVPSLSKRVTDLFLLDVNTQKRRRAQGKDDSWRLRVFLQCGKDRATGLLKTPRPDLVTRARFASLALTYGEKEDADTYFVDLTKIPPSDILDLRALPLVESSEKKSGESALVLVYGEGNWRAYIATCDISSSTYILDIYMGPRKGYSIEIPLCYGKNYTNLNKRGLLRLSGLRLNVTVIREVKSLDEIRYHVLDVIYKWLKWSGLHRLLKDVNRLLEAKAELVTKYSPVFTS